MEEYEQQTEKLASHGVWKLDAEGHPERIVQCVYSSRRRGNVVECGSGVQMLSLPSLTPSLVISEYA